MFGVSSCVLQGSRIQHRAPFRPCAVSFPPVSFGVIPSCFKRESHSDPGTLSCRDRFPLTTCGNDTTQGGSTIEHSRNEDVRPRHMSLWLGRSRLRLSSQLRRPQV